MHTGIYEIVNTVNGKRYVGSAASFASRWRVHRHHLRKGKHHSVALQRAWDKYGEGSFIFRAIEHCGKSDLIVREQYHIDQGCDYNCSPTAASSLGITRTDATKEAVRIASKAMWKNESYRLKQSESRSMFCPTAEWKARQIERVSGENSGMFNPEVLTFCHDNHGCIAETIWWFGKTFGLNKAHLREMTKQNPTRKSHKGWTYKKAPG